MINVTYVGDVLVAYKATGDKNVPKGEVTFKVDLSPKIDPDAILEPIELSYTASKQWGLKYLSRFHGEGQIAEAGFKRPQFIDGQLILVNKYFSFAYSSLNMQIFFGRPSPDMTLKLFRESYEQSSNAESDANHLERCFEETEELMMMESEDNDNDEDLDGTDDDDLPSIPRNNFYDMDGAFQ